MKKIIISLFIFLIFQSGVYAESAMNRIMESWVGENIDNVIKYWGYPTSEKIIAEKKLYYWINNSYVVSGNQYGVYGGEQTCNRILEVDNNKKVIKWQWEGNNCPNFYFTGKNWVNPNNDPWQKEKIQKELLKQERKKLKIEKRGKA